MRPISTQIQPEPNQERTERCYMEIWGRVSKIGGESSTRKGEPKFQFNVMYGEKSDPDEKKFMNCLCVGNTPQMDIARRLRAWDTVHVCGKWTRRKYKRADETEAEWREIKVEFLSIHSDGYREAVIDSLADAVASSMQNGPIQDRKAFVGAFNRAFIDSFWELVQRMQGNTQPEDEDGAAAEADDYEVTI